MFLTKKYSLQHLIKRLQNVGKDVFFGFQSDAEAYGCVPHVHIGTLFRSEESEDGGSRMDGKRTMVEKVGGSVDELKCIDESIALLLVGKVDGEHSARQRSELAE